MYDYNYGFGPGYFFGHVLDLLFWLIVILIVFSVIRRNRGTGGWRHPLWRNSALDLLNERYAKGEINKEEYEAKKKDLMS